MKRLSAGRQLYAVAECSLGGWGTTSQEFSTAFLKRFGEHVEATAVIDGASLSHSAQAAFDESLEQIGTETPEWVSGQYVAVSLCDTRFYVSWIGDMYARFWRKSEIMYSNKPHVGKVGSADGPPFALVLRCFNTVGSDRAQMQPEYAGPVLLAEPMCVFVGNRYAEELLHELEQRTDFRELTQSGADLEWREHYDAVRNVLDTLWDKNFRDAHGLLLFIGRGKEDAAR